MHLLFMRANNLDLPLDLQLKLFDNTVLPILTYGSEIWGYEIPTLLKEYIQNFWDEFQDVERVLQNIYFMLS